MLLRPTCSWMEPPSPRSFAGLMELYESNYIRFRRLCPELKSIQEGAVSRVDDVLDLHLKVLERSRHTSTVGLTYYLEDTRGNRRANPDFRLRIYHDALQTQAVNYVCVGRVARAHLVGCRTALARGWMMNRFLFKWLGYCLAQGHLFSPDHPWQRRASRRAVAD